ncbi:response regulator [Paenibacillus oceani]|uniref:response regulator n=1 Tax=Paenibacillus oceani TaxID=2772510 RepID=UPI00295A841A|nr:response regulator [Paenibacillus oceani]
MALFQVFIVEDEKPILDLMKVIIGRNPYFTITGTFVSPLEALDHLPRLEPDVAFLDVEMPRMNGLELAQNISRLSERTKIVFTTAYKHYALEAFDVYALDYILKPVTPAAIERVAERLLKLHRPVVLNGHRDWTSAIKCFGGLDVRSPEGAPVRFPTRMTEELFAYFLCHPGKEQSKWQLADMLWPDMKEERVSHNLHNTIYRLKKLLKENGIGMDIQKSNEGYLLDTGHVLYDVLAFEKEYDALTGDPKDAEQAERLCALYKGPLLDGKPYLWKMPLEEAHFNKYTALVRYLLAEDLAKQKWLKAEQRLEAYVSLYPVHEEMNRTLMGLYAMRGDKEKIVRQFSVFEHTYRKVLGLEPPQELRDRVASWLG